MTALVRTVEGDGGTVVGSYRDPLGGKWQLLVVLPLDRVKPTPFQRDLSESHVKRPQARIHSLDRFLDPIIAVRRPDGTYWTPNGYHRSAALRERGARAVTALLVPEGDPAAAYQKRGRFAGSAYQPVLGRVEAFLPHALARALEIREERADRLLALDDAVNAAVKELKDRGFESPYLKNFVVARRFDAARIKPDQVARAGGPSSE